MQSVDGKFYITDVTGTQQFFRLIRSIPSPNPSPLPSPSASTSTLISPVTDVTNVTNELNDNLMTINDGEA